MFTLLCAISIQILKFFCKDRRLLLYMSRTLHLFGTDWCAMMVPIQVIRWYRMQCYDGTDSCATVVPIRRYCHVLDVSISKSFLKDALTLEIKGNDLLYKCWDADLLYNQRMELLQVSKRGTRDLQLTLRYKFNTTRSKYKGTGAGNAELNRL